MSEPDVNLAALEISFPCASEAPFVRRSGGVEFAEVLRCSEDAVDLSRLNGGASILKNHDPDRILGKVVAAWIEDARVWVRARFCSDDDARAYFSDIAAGTLQNVSIGYTVDEFEDAAEGDTVTRTATKWTILEVSVAVGIPADPTVGFYRSYDGAYDAAPAAPTETAEPAAETANNAENDLAASFRSAAEAAGVPEVAERAIRSHASPDDFRRDLRAALSVRTLNTPKRSLNMSSAAPQSARRFSVAEALRSMVTGTGAEFEREISAELYRQSGLTPSGENAMMIPINPATMPTMFRAFPSDGQFDAASGSGLVTIENLPDMFVSYVRTKIGVRNATFLTGLTTTTTIPIQTGTGSVAWVDGLNADGAESNPTISNGTLTPHKLSAYTPVGKDLVLQGNPSAVNVAINDLTALLARAIGTAILKGNASSPAITGIATATGVQTVTIADIASATWSDMLKFAGAVDGKEIAGPLEFVMSAADKATLKGIAKDYGRFICEDDRIDGHYVSVDGSLSSGEIFFGDFSNVLVGQWGGLEIMIDPFRYARSGGVEIIATLVSDILVRNPSCFVKRVAPAVTTA